MRVRTITPPCWLRRPLCPASATLQFRHTQDGRISPAPASPSDYNSRWSSIRPDSPYSAIQTSCCRTPCPDSRCAKLRRLWCLRIPLRDAVSQTWDGSFLGRGHRDDSGLSSGGSSGGGGASRLVSSFTRGFRRNALFNRSVWLMVGLGLRGGRRMG